MKLKMFLYFCLLCIFFSAYASPFDEYPFGRGLSASKGLAPDTSEEELGWCDLSGREAIERTRSYWVKIGSGGAPTVASGPMPASMVRGDAIGAPISEVWCSWPTVSNRSIFPFLLGSATSELARFVQDCYQSSCAIVYAPAGREAQIIGSGSFVDGDTWGLRDGVVVTARHNFSDIPIDALYVRFFHYAVFPASSQGYDAAENYLWVDESYLDIPVTSAFVAEGGIDAGVLELLQVSSRKSRQYMRRLARTAPEFDERRTIPTGKYAMFHFADGQHQISVGHVFAPPLGAWVNSDIHIEAGSGASGAALIAPGFGGPPQAVGVSIYRQISDFGTWRSVQRRAVLFDRLTRPGGISDPITAPYRARPDFLASSALNHDEDGPEYLRIRPAGREERPAGAEYDVGDDMDRHHIVPMNNLLYLWDYFHAPSPLPRDIWVRTSYRQKAEESFHSRAERNHVAVRDLLGKLIANPREEDADTRRVLFAWARWNLFEGWKGVYRTDDPKSEVERTRPRGFHAEQWGLLQELNSGIVALYDAARGWDPAVIESAQNNIQTRLQRLYGFLTRGRHSHRLTHLHRYNSEEWVRDGTRIADRHPMFRVAD